MDAVRLLPHFHRGIDPLVSDLLKPGVLEFELIAQYQTKGVCRAHE
jgi:hypothetical protein